MAGIGIVLVEDDWIIAKEIGYSLQDLGFEVLGTYDSGEEALQHISRLQPDIVLLDIDLSGELSGIDVAKRLKEETSIPFIFLTALADSHTIKQAKVVEPYAYLVKPVRPESLYSTIEVTLYNAAHKKEAPGNIPPPQGVITESIFVKGRNRLEKLMLKDILWIEASDIYAMVCTASGRHLLTTSLKTVDERLSAPSFIRVHRSYIVNLDKVEALEEDCLIIQNNKIPIGKTFKDRLMAKISLL